MKRRLLAPYAATLVLLMAPSAGCGATGGDKSGGQQEILVLANNDGNLDGVPAVARFVNRVSELSKGRLTVKVESSWQGGGDESRVIKDVAAGRADLGWAGTRAIDLVGIDNFRPLHAPFLVDSYAAEAAVVKDPLAHELLDSLESLGLTGLALAADQLRFPAGVARPLLTPVDFAGMRFRTVASQVQSDGIRALGAEPTSEPANNADLAEATFSGELGGFETMWWTYLETSQYGFAPFVTANAVLWPRTLVVFANTKTMERLGESARGSLIQAAEEAGAWSTAHAGDAESGQIQTICRFGARIATATPEQLAALRKAAEPVYAAMRSDPKLGLILNRVEALAATAGEAIPPAVPENCIYRSGDEKLIPPPARSLTGPGRTGDLPQGVYRYTLSMADLLAHGLNDHDATINAGVWTWTIRGGRWTIRQSPIDSSVKNTLCEGWYDVQRNAATFTTTTKIQSGDCAPSTWAARWSAHEGNLTWSAVSVSDFSPIFASKVWQRIE